MSHVNDNKIDEIAAEAASKATKPKRPKKTRSPISKLAVLNLFLLLGVSGYAYLTWLDALSERDQLIADNQLLVASDSERLSQVGQLQSQLADVTTQLERLSLVESVTRQHTQRIASLEEDVLGVTDQDRRLWRLEEVAFLLRVARERLLLSDDTASAEALLENADAQLQAIGGYDLRDVRAGVASDLLVVRTAEAVDRVGIYASVSALSQQVDEIKWRTSEDTSNELSNTVAKQTMWDRLSQLVTVHDLSQSSRPAILPENDYFLNRTLQLMLEESLLALMESDAALWRASIERALNWVNEHALRNEHTGALKAELERLHAMHIGVAKSDIGAGERALTLYRDRMAEGASQ